MRIHPQADARYAFQARNARTPVINVGCESDPVGFGCLPGTVNMDIDDWSSKVQNFVRHDACVVPWPFGDKTFDTVIFGDSLDHMEAPRVAIGEALRVARRMIVVTLPKDAPPAESDHEDHIKDLTAQGLGATAPGDLRRRHGHFTLWTEDRVRQLLSDLPDLQLGALWSGDPGSPVWYWAAFSRLGLEPSGSALPSVSVLTCSYRPGGLDILFSGLADQDYLGEWELVFVDELYEARKAIVAELTGPDGRWPIRNLKHIPNRRSQYPRCSVGKAHNEAILAAEGKIGIWLGDYTSTRADWIRQHVGAHLRHGRDNLAVNGAFYYCWPPRLRSALRPPVDPFDPTLRGCTSLFDHPLGVREIQALPLQGRSWDEVAGVWIRAQSGQDEASMHCAEDEVDCQYFFQKHDSLPVALMRAVGGQEEALDGLHRFHDTVLALRLAALGVVFHHSKRPAVRIVQMRHLMQRLGSPIPAEAIRQGDQFLAEAVRRVQAGVLLPQAGHPDLIREAKVPR